MTLYSLCTTQQEGADVVAAATAAWPLHGLQHVFYDGLSTVEGWSLLLTVAILLPVSKWYRCCCCVTAHTVVCCWRGSHCSWKVSKY